MTSDPQQHQALREQKVARLLDREVMPIWHHRFASMLWRHLPQLSEALVLDLHCGSGHTTGQLLERLELAKVMGIEPNESLRGMARSRMTPSWADRVYLRAGDLADVADLPDSTYDLVVANLVLGEANNRAAAVLGLRRITRPGGSILATLPMAGSWEVAEDLFREVLLDAGLARAAMRLDRVIGSRPSGSDLASVLTGLGIARDHFVIEQERFSLLFASGREFLFSPLVEFGPLRLWRAILGEDEDHQQIFWRFKEAIDTYFSDHVFSVDVVAGLLRLSVPEAGAAGALAAAETAGDYWRRYPELDALWREAEGPAASAGFVEVEIDFDEGDAPAPARQATRPHPVLRGAITPEDEAILALLDRPAHERRDAQLDALLDQVLEFAGPREDVEELADDELEEMPEASARTPGETLKRIRALLPPPPAFPPPPPLKKSETE